MKIPLEGKLLSIRIEVVTVDLKAYEHYDCQSYAQVVINGTRRKSEIRDGSQDYRTRA